MYINVRMVNKFSSSLIASQFGKKKKRKQEHASTTRQDIDTYNNKSRLKKFHSRRTRSRLRPTAFESHLELFETIPFKFERTWSRAIGNLEILRGNVSNPTAKGSDLLARYTRFHLWQNRLSSYPILLEINVTHGRNVRSIGIREFSIGAHEGLGEYRSW